MAPVGYITLNDNLIIKEANLAASRLLGSEKGQFINKGISSFISDDQHESLYLHYRRLSSARENPTHIFTIKRRDGSEVEIQFESNLGHDGRANGFRSVLIDVTELRKAKEGLQHANDQLEEKVLQRTKDLSESEAGYRSLFENSLDAVILTKPDGSILSANPAACRMFIMTEAELIEAVGLAWWSRTKDRDAVRRKGRGPEAPSSSLLQTGDGTTFVGEEVPIYSPILIVRRKQVCSSGTSLAEEGRGRTSAQQS